MNGFDVNEGPVGRSITDVWRLEPCGEAVSAPHRGVISKV